MKNQLTDLDIGEVSLVDKGAIGEVFTVVKCEDPTKTNELVSQLTKGMENNKIVESLNQMSNEDFVNTMESLISRYNEINKGGNDMNEDQIKEIVKSAMDETLSTINKNFASINKTIDEVQKACQDNNEKIKACAEPSNKKTKRSKTTEEDPEDATDGGSDEATEDANGKQIKTMKKSLDDLSNTVSTMSKALDAVASIKETVDKMAGLKLDESLSGITKRLDDIEKQENPSNSLQTDVNKGAGTGTPKEPFWKSILGVPSQE